MNRFLKTTAAALAALCVSSAAMADQYIVSLDAPLAKVSDKLLGALHMEIVDAFAHDGANFVVLETRGIAYVEAFFNAVSTIPLEVHELPVDWAGPPMAQIDLAARLGFGQRLACGFCAS